MIVPGGNGQNAMLQPQVGQGEMPSHADLLMSAAQLHQQRLAGDVDKSLPFIPPVFVPLQLEKSPPPGESLFQKGMNPPRKPGDKRSEAEGETKLAGDFVQGPWAGSHRPLSPDVLGQQMEGMHSGPGAVRGKTEQEKFESAVERQQAIGAGRGKTRIEPSGEERAAQAEWSTKTPSEKLKEIGNWEDHFDRWLTETGMIPRFMNWLDRKISPTKEK